ncbi:hypothetical protein OROMI_005168 [Orobanche minor]
MAAFIFFLLLISAVIAADKQNISPGSFLITPTSNSSSSSSSWLSPSGRYAFGFFPQKNNTFAVGIFINNIAGSIQKKKTGQTIVWTANTKNPTVANDAVLNFTKDGRLILQQRQGQQDIDLVGPANRTEAIAHASMLDSGNFVLYGSDSRIIWQSFDHPTDTLLPGQHLPAGGELFSSASDTDHSRGIFRLKMQSDGNLVQYPVKTPDTATNAYYASGTAGTGGNVSLNLADDGRLYLLNGSSFLMNITMGGLPSRGTIHLMRIDADGIFRTYSHDSLLNNDSWIVRWSSTDDKCVPKGVCGLNAFCVLMDMNASCECLPGHDFVRSGDSSADCARGSTWKVCGNNKYEMKKVKNTVWEDNSYNVLNTPMIEDCMRACQDDCNCEAAFFKDERCSKQRVPMQFGRRQPGDSNVALIKVSAISN